MNDHSLLLNFAKTKRIDPRITFSRADTNSNQASYYGSDGLIKYAGIGEPRFTHDPSTGSSLGLLIEEARTNLLTYSEDFRNTTDAGETRPWTYSNLSLTSNDASAPDGTTTADKITVTASSTTASILGAGLAYAKNSTFSASLYCKAGAEYDYIYIQVNAYSGNVIRGHLQFSTGLTGAVASGAGGSASASAVSIGDGWYRLTLSGIPKTTDASTGVQFSVGVAASLSTLTISAATGTGYFYVWGAQLEQASTPSSYIPTVASTVTRVADSAVMTGANFSSWYRQDEGTFVVEAIYPPTEETRSVFVVWDGTTSNRTILYANSANNGAFTAIASGVQGLFTQTTNTFAASSRALMAGAYKTDDMAVALNGGTVNNETSGGIPTVNRMNFATSGITVNPQLIVSRLSYYPFRLSNTQLQALSKV